MRLLHAVQWAALLCALAALAYPIYVIRPFRHQGARELAAALLLLRTRPAVELLLSLVSVTLAVIVWRASGRFGSKLAAIFCTALTFGAALLSRVNVYEKMFHPLDRPEFSSAAQSKLNGNEEVIAIRLGNAARAYPVRSMSYHHIVNDVVGGVPIVATY